MTAREGTTPNNDPELPPEIDTTRPTIARVYDALLGGKDNFAPDRKGARTYLEYVPDADRCAVENREALVKGVQYLAHATGINQFLDIGSGLPTVKNTHEAAQEINPNARVVYIDNDPIVLAHGRTLLATNNTTTVVTADLREPQSILDHPETRRMLDFSRPIALMVVGLLMHFHDDEQPDEWIRVLVNAMPSGSYLFITDFVDTGEPLQKRMEQAGLESLGNGWIRTPERIQEHFLGLPLVPPDSTSWPAGSPKSLSARFPSPRNWSHTSGFSWRASGANRNRRGRKALYRASSSSICPPRPAG